MFGTNHKALENIENKICALRQDYVEAQEKSIVFGDAKSWKDVEADTRPYLGSLRIREPLGWVAES